MLPTLWFRNTWSWTQDETKPRIGDASSPAGTCIVAEHPTLGTRYLYCDGEPDAAFTENETNRERLYGVPNPSPHVKDGINDYVVQGRAMPSARGARVRRRARSIGFDSQPGEARTVRLRLSDEAGLKAPFGKEFAAVLAERKAEADEFYADLNAVSARTGAARRAASGVGRTCFGASSSTITSCAIGSKAIRRNRRRPRDARSAATADWDHLYTDDVLSMPDTWEYPWFAAWDMAFHLIPFAMIDPDFAKRQLTLLTREWYMHPNGQIPAYEWAFGDVNPPVHAWAALRIFKIEKKMSGEADYLFLERVFQKLLMNFTWWVNRKDQLGNNVFQGGFLGLDNIGVFDRSSPLPTRRVHQPVRRYELDGRLRAQHARDRLELAQVNPAYEDVASKFYEHFLYIADAMNSMRGGREHGLWHEEDGFYYDVLRWPDGGQTPLHPRDRWSVSFRCCALEVLEPSVLARLPAFEKRMDWFIRNRPDLRGNVACMEPAACGARRLLAIAGPRRLRRAAEKMLDETEFLGPYGIRALSRDHSRTRSRSTSKAASTASITSRRNRQRAIRRQLQLARAGLVSAQLPDRRGAAEVSLLSRATTSRWRSDGLGPRADALGDRDGTLAPVDVDLRSRATTGGGRSTAAT